MNENTDGFLQGPARRRFLTRVGQGLGAAAAVPFLPVTSSHAAVAEPSPGCATDRVKLPGRLGDPDATLATDERIDP